MSDASGSDEPTGGAISRLIDPLTDFLHDEAASGVVLLLATIGALVWANFASDSYTALWGPASENVVQRPESGLVRGLLPGMDPHHFVNDGLMAIFFFVVGLEIKRELVTGELQDRRAAVLPVIAAVGGVAVPALIYTAMTAGTPLTAGWAIPAATDIAFAVGVLALLGNRVPAALKLFLLTVAIVDDIAAIVIIAVFYSHGLSLMWLLLALAGLGGVALMRSAGVTSILAYVPLALFIWLATARAGVHPTIAGVALGLMTPTGLVGGRNVLELLERHLHPVSGFLVVPLFAIANAGIDFSGGILTAAAGSVVTSAIAVALVVGKPLGIAGATLLAVRLGVGKLPAGVSNTHVWGVAALGGIGFTVSLFIAQLAFAPFTFDYPEPQIDNAKVGIFIGSIISGLLGAGLLLRANARTRQPDSA